MVALWDTGREEGGAFIILTISAVATCPRLYNILYIYVQYNM